MKRGEIWWANLREPIGSEPGYRRPAVIVSIDDMNLSPIGTVMVVIFTSNLTLAAAPGNVLVHAGKSGLLKDSVVNVSQLATTDKGFLSEYIGVLDADTMLKVSAGLRLVMNL